MKIAFFSCSTIFGGVEKIIVDSVNSLCNDHKILLIVPFGCTFKNRLSSAITLYEYKSYDKRYNPFLYLELYDVLKKFTPDILHTHAAKASQIGFILEKFLPLKLVATKHNNRKGAIFNRIKNVISVSNEVAKTIQNKSKTIYFGASPKPITSQKNDIFTIIAIGRLDKIKGFDILIEAVSKLSFAFKLQIVGDGAERKNLENLINSLNLNDKAQLLGFRDDIPELLASSHLQVISSHKEGFPVTLVEGIFYSNIIISTPVGGIVEIISPDFLTTHDTLREKIVSIAQNYEASVIAFAKEHEKYKGILTLEHYIQNLTNYYKEVLCNP